MKQIHKLKELNRKLEDALIKIDKLTTEHKGPHSNSIHEIIEDALDRKGNKH